MITESTKENLRRKSGFIDTVQRAGGVPHAASVPLFSWLELSLTELCNRACSFCPRADADLYPNQGLHMPARLLSAIGMELDNLRYTGTVALCGYGEPLLHPNVVEAVNTLRSHDGPPGRRVEIVTNGDRLDAKMAGELFRAGATHIVVSMYDGPHQVEHFREVFARVNRGEEWFTLRDRWHTEADAFGLKLTNRAGTVSVGPQDAVEATRPCHYLAYQMMIDWNGDALLCPQDWQKKVKLGNVGHTSLLNVWTSPAARKHRARLIAGRRNVAPCSSCNADGTLHGFNHVRAWEGKT